MAMTTRARIILAAFAAILAVVMATGCARNSSGWPVIPFMNNGHSQRAAVQSKAAPSIALVPLPEDDCGACLTNSSIINPPTERILLVTFTASKPYDGFNLYGGTNLDRSDWTLLLSTNATSIPVKADHGYYFFGLKAFLRNGINGSETESDWATR